MEIADEHKEIMLQAIRDTVTVLDVKIPDWRQRIDWETFVFSSFANCIYGQLSVSGDVDGLLLLPGFDVPSSVQRNYPSNGFEKPPELWQFMEDEWRKFSKNDLTTMVT